MSIWPPSVPAGASRLRIPHLAFALIVLFESFTFFALFTFFAHAAPHAVRFVRWARRYRVVLGRRGELLMSLR
ncbi:hypothetical protein WMF30_06145 [Sorangium sp. So ce134]